MARLACLLLLASCGPIDFVRYELDTRVSEDGGWSRTYVSRGYRKAGSAPAAPEYQPVSSVHCAALPPCPPEQVADAPPPEPLPACSAEEVRPLGNFVARDRCGTSIQRQSYRRTGRANTEIAADFRDSKVLHGTARIAGNTVTVSRYDLGVIVFYGYRETYRQWLTPGDVMDAGRVALDLVLELALEVLHEELGADYDVSGVEGLLRGARAELAEIVAIVATSDLERGAAETELSRRFKRRGVPLDDNGGVDEERAGEWFDEHISPLLVPKRARAPRLTWADLSSEYFQNYLEAKWKKRRDALTDQDGPLMAQFDILADAFSATEFRLRVELPGRLVDTDGAVGTDGAVTWHLDPDTFEVEPREVHALSVHIDKRFSKLYPRADLDGQGLVALAEIARVLSEEERTEVRALLGRRDTRGLSGWCATSASGPRLLHRLGLELECEASP